MNENDFDAFRECLVGLAEIRGHTLSAPAIALFFRSMQHWEIGLFRSAAEHLLRTLPRLPTPADFENLRAAWQNTTGEAWSRAVAFSKTLYTPTGHRDGALGDYTIDTAVRCIGGYRAIANCPTDQVHWLEKRFAERLRELQDVIGTRAALPGAADKLALRSNTMQPLANLLPRI